jgi:hypothetical protein
VSRSGEGRSAEIGAVVRPASKQHRPPDRRRFLAGVFGIDGTCSGVCGQ